MFMASFFSWWYGSGWLQVLTSFKPRLNGIIETFSVTQLLNTLFAPWRRIITYPGASLATKFHAWGDNIFSRTIGFFVRFIVLLAALLTSLVISLGTLIELIIWPLIPPAALLLVIIGIIR
jgi:hypothetical protein